MCQKDESNGNASKGNNKRRRSRRGTQINNKFFKESECTDSAIQQFRAFDDDGNQGNGSKKKQESQRKANKKNRRRWKKVGGQQMEGMKAQPKKTSLHLEGGGRPE